MYRGAELQRKRVSSDSSVAEALAHSDSLRSAKPALSRVGGVHRSNTTAADFKPTSRFEKNNLNNANNVSADNLFECVKKKDHQKLKELHKKGADLCVQDPVGRTLLHYAVEVGSKEIVRYIIDNAINLKAAYVEEIFERVNTHRYPGCNRERKGDTPKHRAEKAKDAELAAYLENRQHYQMIQREDQETAV
ncbi:hypothetical protein cypCar_00036893 [Cyprinus carpio]|nr:hypothetical protein cypCar_00036893 [Cyprinus carpio]